MERLRLAPPERHLQYFHHRYGLAEAAGTARMAFVVDDTALGKSKVVVLHAKGPVFAALRPMSESVDSFAAALARTEGGADLAGRFTVDSRLFTTEAK